MSTRYIGTTASALASPVSPPGPRGRVKLSPVYDSVREEREFLLREFFGPHFVTCFCLFQDDEGAWSPIFFFPIVEILHQVLSENLGGKIMDNAIDYYFQ